MPASSSHSTWGHITDCCSHSLSASNAGLVLYLSHSRPSSLTAYPRREVPELSRRLPCVCPEYHIWYLPSFFRRHMRLTSSSHPVDASGASTMRGGSHEKPSLLNDTAMDFLDRHEKYILYPSLSGRTKTSKHSPSSLPMTGFPSYRPQPA